MLRIAVRWTGRVVVAGAVLGLGVALAATTLPLTAAGVSASPPAAGAAAANVAVTPQQAGIAALMQSYSADMIGSDWWQAAVAQSTLETYEQATGDTTYFQDIADTYNAYKDAHFGNFTNDFADDTGWWGLAWLQAYNMTGNTVYLQTAEDDANYIDQYWDTNASSCGGQGGVWWQVQGTGAPQGRGTIANALFMQLTAGLHDAIPGDTKYLGWAESTWSWLDSSGLIQSGGLVYNGWNGTCQLTGPYWTYNQGAVIAAVATLYQATGNASLLTEGEKVASAAIATLAPNGVLAETCEPSSCDGDQVAFKGIFVRDLKILATTAGTSQYNSFFAAQAASIEANDTNASGQSGLVWSAPLSTCSSALTGANPCNTATQASAEEALVAAFTPPARPAAVVDTGGTVRVFARATGGGIAGGGLEEDSLSPGSSAWSGFTSLGGATPYGPAAVAAADGGTWVFVVGADGVLYADHLPAGSSAWSGWSSLGTPASMRLLGTPAVVEDQSGVIRVFARGADGNLYTDSESGGSWSGFSDLGGIWPWDVAALVGASGYVHVFAVGTTGNLYHDQLPPAGSWSGWGNLGGSVTGVPAVTQDSAGTTRAYARETSSGALEEFYAVAGSTSYATDSRGGSWPCDEAAVAGSGTYAVSLFGVGTTGNAYWQSMTTAQSWSPWTDLGGNFTGVPAAVSLTDGDIDLFADSAGSIEVSQLSGSTWSGWSALGGNL